MADSSAASSKDSRHLTFTEGSSQKFWKIELDGSSHTVNYGRIGTAGQTQTKDFQDGPAARKSFDQLVAEKIKKGYVDSSGTVSTEAKPEEPATSKKPAKPKQPATQAASEDSPAPPAEAAAVPPKSGDVDLVIRREIRLAPEDWNRAGFRTRPVLERQPPRAFDKDACLERMAKLKTTTYGWEVRWADLKLPPTISREEAQFWFVAMTEKRDRETTMEALSAAIGRKKSIKGDLSIDDAIARLHGFQHGLPEEVSLALANLFSPEDHLELILKRDAHPSRDWYTSRIILPLISGFARYVIPYLPEDERETLRRRIRKDWDPKKEPAASYDCLPAEYFLAASLRMHDAVREVTSHWADDRFVSVEGREHYEHAHELVFGLESPEAVAAEWRRLKLKPWTVDHILALLACTEYATLDCIADRIVGMTDKESCESMLKVFALVVAPEAAELMLRCKLAAKAPAAARDWLDRHVGCAVAGLIETACGRGQLADAALDYLQGVKRKGLEAIIVEALTTAKPENAVRIRAEVLDREEKVYEPFDAKSTPEWLTEAIRVAGPGKKVSLPSWATPPILPPLIAGGKRLNDQQVTLVLQRLAATPVGQKDPLLTAIRENVLKSARDEFAWKMFQSWQEGGYPTKEKWAMGAIAHIGDDGCVLKLTPRIRAWPGESQHARAVFGLECLRAIGSSVALMQLAGIAQKLKFKGLKAKAEEFVEEIAKERGLTRDELEDRVVPDCGLDENGRREFPFGPRSFSFVLGGDLKAMVREESGKLRPNLPDPNSKDDADLAAASVEEWKLLKKQIKEVATIQAGRLEQAMVTGRRWAAEDFETLLVRHPLMTHLAQKLIWAGFDAKGKRTVTFRITEERDLADPEDDTVTLDGATTVGLVHPLELTDAEKSRWGEVLGDYEVVPPFPQLGRTVYSLEAGEDTAGELKRFEGTKLPAPTLVFTLEKLGWTRGTAMDGGCFDEHSKQFPAANVTAVVGYDGTAAMGYIDPSETLTVKSVHFCKGLRDPSGYGWDLKTAIKVGQVPAIVISEVLADLHILKSKAK